MKRRSGNEAGTFFTPEEMSKLLSVIDDEQDRLIISTAYAFGLRVNEVLQIESTQLQDGRLLICTSKSGVRQSVPLSSGLLDVGAELIRVALLRPGQRLFNRPQRTLNYRMHGYAKKAGLGERRGHMHSLRHSCARHVLALTGDLTVTQAILRHKSLASTGQYLKTTADEAADAVTTAMQTKAQSATA